MELAVFAIVLVAVFAAKVASVVLSRDELVGKSAEFSWMDSRAQAELPAGQAPARRASESTAPVFVGRSPRIA